MSLSVPSSRTVHRVPAASRNVRKADKAAGSSGEPEPDADGSGARSKQTSQPGSNLASRSGRPIRTVPSCQITYRS